MRAKESPVLVIIVQTALYLIQLLAVWLFLRGHNQPGGGFIAGVVFAAGITLQGLTFGHEAADRVMPVPVWVLLGGGLAAAFAAVAFPLVLGLPMMKSGFTGLDLPLFGHIELATAVIFDLGVFLVVIGSAKSIVLHIAAERSEDRYSPGRQRGR